MNLLRQLESAEIDKSSETERNIRARSSITFGLADSSDGGKSANGLSTLLGRVTEASTREIDNLIGELQAVREKLRDDGNRIQCAIEEYAALSQQVTQLTKIIAEGMQKLLNA